MRFDVWTFLFQIANFLALAWLLERFLYEPILKAVAKRQAAVDADLARAKAAREELARLSREEVETRERLAREREEALALEREREEAERAALVDRARAEADAAARQARLAVQRERTEAEQALEAHAAEVAVAVAGRLLALCGTSADAALLEAALGELEATPRERRLVLLGPARPARLRLLTARALAPDALARVEARLEAALGPALALEAAADPALVAGAELALPNAVFRHSWREALSRARAELAHVHAA